MQASRILISTLAAVGIVGLAGPAMAQTTTTTAPGATTTTTPSGTTSTTVTPPTINRTNETEAERMERERMDRGRMARDSVNAPAGSGGMNRDGVSAPAGSAGTYPRAADSSTDSTARRDANGNLTPRADRN